MKCQWGHWGSRWIYYIRIWGPLCVVMGAIEQARLFLLSQSQKEHQHGGQRTHTSSHAASCWCLDCCLPIGPKSKANRGHRQKIQTETEQKSNLTCKNWLFRQRNLLLIKFNVSYIFNGFSMCKNWNLVLIGLLISCSDKKLINFTSLGRCSPVFVHQFNKNNQNLCAGRLGNVLRSAVKHVAYTHPRLLGLSLLFCLCTSPDSVKTRPKQKHPGSKATQLSLGPSVSHTCCDKTRAWSKDHLWARALMSEQTDKLFLKTASPLLGSNFASLSAASSARYPSVQGNALLR